MCEYAWEFPNNALWDTLLMGSSIDMQVMFLLRHGWIVSLPWFRPYQVYTGQPFSLNLHILRKSTTTKYNTHPLPNRCRIGAGFKRNFTYTAVRKF